MREIRLHGSEGGGTELNRSFLPLSGVRRKSKWEVVSGAFLSAPIRARCDLRAPENRYIRKEAHIAKSRHFA